MPKGINSTLTEMQIKLSEILFKILQGLEPEAWENQGQIIYSGVDDWDTAYNAYLTVNNIKEVKFPFCTLTRIETQSAFSEWNSPLTVHQAPTYKQYEVDGAVVRPVQCRFNWTIYRKDHLRMEDLIDSLIIFGSETQQYQFDSEVLGLPSEFSFHFEAPTHVMIPNKDERIRGRGHIFSLTVPVVVDCVLGVPKDQKLIVEIIQKIILENSQEVLFEEIITDPEFPPVN